MKEVEWTKGVLRIQVDMEVVTTVPQQLQMQKRAQPSLDDCTDCVWTSLISPKDSHTSMQGKTERIKK